MIRTLRLLVAGLLVAVTIGGCGGRDRLAQEFAPEVLYERGRAAMLASNYEAATNNYLTLIARYPFANESRQAHLDLIHVFWASNQPERTIDAAEQFEREHPTHPQVAYSIYMRGLAWFDQDPNVLERLFRIDMSARPPKDTLRSFEMFERLIREFPDSEYVPDARERMVFLRNRLAAYENHVADYYLRREAFVAAANRAKYAVENYAGAPELERSLEIMIEAYERLGMTELADDARRVMVENFGRTAGTARSR